MMDINVAVNRWGKCLGISVRFKYSFHFWFVMKTVINVLS